MKRQAVDVRVGRAAQYTLEMLESRQMLSAAMPTEPVALLNGTLLVRGTDKADTIAMHIDALAKSMFDVDFNGKAYKFPVVDVKVVRAYGFGGSDSITTSQTYGAITVPIYMYGGNGNDTLVGASGLDTLLGANGNDLVQGQANNDWLEGNQGDDRILGGDGRDTLLGGLGKDVINSGAGKDDVRDIDRQDQVDTGAALSATPAKKLRYEGTPQIKRRGARGRTPNFNAAVTGYTPTQIRNAYQFGDLSDTTFTNRGQGQTIVIIGAYHYANAMSDLNVFSRQFGLPEVTSKTFSQSWATGSGMAPEVTDPNWAVEGALDLQWAHAIAPEAKLVYIEAETNLAADLFNAIGKGVKALLPTGGVIALSFGAPEFLTDPALEDSFKNFYTGNVTFIASAGDTAGAVSHPAVSSEVTAVGGTYLPLDGAGNLLGTETAWSEGGGGQSTLFDRPAYQDQIVIEGVQIGGLRVTPDVAYNADPLSGVAVFCTVPNTNGDTGWQAVGGTSAGTVQWAGIVALANQRRVALGNPMLGGNSFNNYLYGIARKYTSEVFTDITIGNNTHNAADGFDMATGWGTPVATNLINRLAAEVSKRKPVQVRTTLDYYFKANYTRLTWPSIITPAIVNLYGEGNARLSPLNADLRFNQYVDTTAVTYDQISVDALALTRDGNTISGRGTASVLLGDGEAGLFLVRFEGRLYRTDGIDKIVGKFYAISSRGRKLMIGLQPALDGSFGTDLDLPNIP